MRKFWTFAAAAALTALAIGNAEACGRRGRGGGCGGGSAGGCGGAAFYGGAVFYGGGCDSCGGAFGAYGIAGNGFTGYGNSAWAWKQVGPSLLLEHLPSGALYASGSDGVFRPTLGAGAAAMPTGGASRAIAADRAKRASAVFTFDPLTGQAHQVGWLNADGTLRPMAAPEGIGAPPK